MSEDICYYCKHLENHGLLSPDYVCGITGKKVETYDYCDKIDKVDS